MALVLEENGFVGWKGATGSRVHLKVQVVGSSKLVDVTYNGETVSCAAVDAKTWTLDFAIVAGGHRAIFTFATIEPETVDIFEVDADDDLAPAPAAIDLLAAAEPVQQEIAGCNHAMTPMLAPQIEGV